MIEDVFRDEWPRVVATLARRFGDLTVAEEAAGEAVVAAVTAWRERMPPNPGGWLMVTANRKAIDLLRRESQREAKQAEAFVIRPEPEASRTVEDDQLGLIFACCHPALAPEARLGLTLRLVAGLTVGEIAGALLSSEVAIGRRITRAKAKIKEAHIPLVVPERLEARLASVLAVIYLIFNEGYLPGSDAGLRIDLSDESIRLARLLHGLLPDEPEVTGLLALVLLSDARRAARVDAVGELVTLEEQDRTRWDGALVAEGQAMVRACVEVNRPGPYQLQAAINAVHTSAGRFRDTDWAALATLYGQLSAMQPTPVVALNRAVVTAELDGPEVALAVVDGLPLTGYHAFHATRAELLRRLDRWDEARTAYGRAMALTRNPAEIRHLVRRRNELPGGT